MDEIFCARAHISSFRSISEENTCSYEIGNTSSAIIGASIPEQSVPTRSGHDCKDPIKFAFSIIVDIILSMIYRVELYMIILIFIYIIF